jgi:uncharacterized Rmd1/YagE family protein
MFETECLHTPYLPPPTSSSGFRSPALKPAVAHTPVPEGDLLNLDGDERPKRSNGPRRKTGFSKRPGSRRGSKADGAEHDHADSGDDDDFEEEEWVPDVFLFEYGTVVIWGMTEKEEKAFLRSL